MSRAPVCNVPNAITFARIAMVPVLLVLAWRGQATAYSVLLGIALAADLLDGFAARVLRQQTPLGAKLDSWGDLITALSYPPAALWLRPDALSPIAPFVGTALVAYLAPIGLGFAKYGRLTSYHTRLSTGMAYAMAVGIISFFAGWSDWPFRFACGLLVVSQIEEVAITLVLPTWRTNIKDVRHALALRRRQFDDRESAAA
jgi:phosphatidylglycerophosphate synthase